jgi:AraC family transcriptional activator of pobA
MEREAIGRIRQLRADHRDNSVHSELEERAEIIHDILRGYHGNVKLRLEVISTALGSTMRTLEREFVAKYSETMNSFHEKIRLEYAERLLRFNPDIKLMSIAAELGYDRASEFNRFFRRKKGVSLTEYVQGVRSRQEKGDFSNDPTPGSGQK